MHHVALLIFRHVAVFGHILLEFLGHVFAVEADLGEPAEVVEAEVIHLQVVAVAAQDLGHVALDGHRHIADVQDAGVGTQLEGRLGHDGRRVGVVDDPVGGFGPLFAVVDQFHHGIDGAQAVGQAAGAAGFLAHHAVLQGDLLILFTHGVEPHAHLGEDEVRIGHSGLRVGGQGQLQVGVKHLHHMADDNAHGFLALGVDVVEDQFLEFEFVLLVQKALDDAGGVGTAAAGDDKLEGFHSKHLPCCFRLCSACGRGGITRRGPGRR